MKFSKLLLASTVGLAAGWSLRKAPNSAGAQNLTATANMAPPANAMSVCNSRPASHICDPDELLSADTLKTQTEELLRMSTTKQSTLCGNQRGYEAYVALIDVPEEGARAAATDIGRHWGVLGSECANGIMAVYSTRDKVFTIVADKQLEEHVLQPHVEAYIASSSLGIWHYSTDTMVSSMVSMLDDAVNGKLNMDQYTLPMLVQSGAEFLLYTLSCMLGVAASVLLVCCMYDAGAHYRHRAHFHSCQKKVQRVHEVFLSKKGELPLCPYCVGPVSSTANPSEVVFLCGHRFHVDCANRWFLGRPEQAGKCPLCECQRCTFTRDSMDEEVSEIDEAKTFILNSLHEQYPEIVSSVAVHRWASCHTEIWLSELSCPRYQSIFNKHSNK